MDCGWFDVSGFQLAPPEWLRSKEKYDPVVGETSNHKYQEHGYALSTVGLLERLDALTEDLLALKERLETTEPPLGLPSIREEVRKEILLVVQEYGNVNKQWQEQLKALQDSLADLSSTEIPTIEWRLTQLESDKTCRPDPEKTPRFGAAPARWVSTAKRSTAISSEFQVGCESAEACPETRRPPQEPFSTEQRNANEDSPSGCTNATACTNEGAAGDGAGAAETGEAEPPTAAGDREPPLLIHRHPLVHRCVETDKRINELAESLLQASKQLEERIEVVRTKADQNASQLKVLADKVVFLEDRQREAGNDLDKQKAHHEQRLADMSERLEGLQLALARAQEEIGAVRLSVGTLRKRGSSRRGAFAPCFEEHVRSTLDTLQYQVNVLSANQIQIQQSVGQRLRTETASCCSRRASISEASEAPLDDSRNGSGKKYSWTLNSSNRIGMTRRGRSNSKDSSRGSCTGPKRGDTAEVNRGSENDPHSGNETDTATAAAAWPASAGEAPATVLNTPEADGTSEGATEKPAPAAEEPLMLAGEMEEVAGVPLTPTLPEFDITENSAPGISTGGQEPDLIAVVIAEHYAESRRESIFTTYGGAARRDSSLRRVKLNLNGRSPSPSITLRELPVSAVSFFAAAKEENSHWVESVPPPPCEHET